MIEIKSTTKKNINKEPGKETFTIQKKWMDKLKVEANAENMEFSYLMFSFKEDDDNFYCVTDKDVITSMIATMKHDREKLNENEHQKLLAEKRASLLDAENTKLRAEIEYLKELGRKDFKLN